MSYSFSVKAATKAEAETKVRDELVKVVTSQPIHKRDCDQAFNAAETFIRLLADDDTRDVYVSVSGSLSWDLKDGVERFTGASVSVSASLIIPS